MESHRNLVEYFFLLSDQKMTVSAGQNIVVVVQIVLVFVHNTLVFH